MTMAKNLHFLEMSLANYLMNDFINVVFLHLLFHVVLFMNNIGMSDILYIQTTKMYYITNKVTKIAIIII